MIMMHAYNLKLGHVLMLCVASWLYLECRNRARI